MKRLTLRDLGEQLGLSRMAVSLALRNHPSLPRGTRERVQALAAELGYRPDPALAALNAHRQSRRHPAYQATIGWLNTFPDPVAYHEAGVFLEYLEGAQMRADALGYKLEEFHVPDIQQWKRLPKVLRARRIEAILVPPPPKLHVEGYQVFPWQDFFALAIGTRFELPLHLVVNDQFQSAGLAVRRLSALGYRRIGLGMPDIFAVHNEDLFMGGYQTACTRLGLPAFGFIDTSPNPKTCQKNIVSWAKRHRLDALIVPGPGDLPSRTGSTRFKLPAKTALAFLSRFPAHPEVAGIDQHSLQIGVSAANHLVDLIRRNERGIPDLPLRHLIPGSWVDGESARMKS